MRSKKKLGSKINHSGKLNAVAAERLEARTLFAVNPAVVDVLLAYTPQSAQSVGGTDQMVNKLRRAIADTNAALVNSQINASWRIVGIMQTGYNEPATPAASQSVLTQLETAGQGFDDVRAQKTALGADVAELITNTADGGVTDPANGFGVSVPKWINADIISHELGHSLGGGHTRALDNIPTGGGVAHDFQPVINGVTYGEGISGRTINYYSNPNVSFRGVSTGVADNLPNSADNAAAMNQGAPTAAAIAASVVPVTSGPLAGLGPITNGGSNTINFKVIYYDGAGVDVTTLGNGNVTVTGPNNFSGSATFLGIDNQQNIGPQAVTANSWNSPVVIADYSITTTGAPGDLSAYAFALANGSVKNIAGIAANGGTMLDASGDTVVPSVAQPPLLPRYGGSGTGLAAELGNLSGQSLVLNDWAGNYYQNSSFDQNYYHFTLANPGVLNVGSTGSAMNIGIYASDASTRVTNGSSVAAGDYYVVVTPAYAAGSATGTFTLKLSATAVTAPTGTIGGFVYVDSNKNGLFDAGSEYGDWANVTLTGTDTTGKPVNLTVNSLGTPSGNFTFANVPVSDTNGYTLTWTPGIKGFYTVGAGAILGGAPGTVAANGTITGVKLTTAGQTVSGYNMALITPPPRTSISGFIWNDTDNNGILNTGEQPLVGQTLTLTGKDYLGNAVSTTTVSDATGWAFGGLAASDASGYTVTAPAVPGLVPGTFTVGNIGGTANAAASSIGGINVSGNAGLGYNFAFVTPPTTMTTPLSPDTTTTVNQGGSTTGNVLTGATTLGTLFDYSGGFAGAQVTANGNASIQGTTLQVTPNAGGQNGSAYYSTAVDITKFTTLFTINQNAGAGDGMTFVVQNNNVNAIGAPGGGLGYQDMGKSIAIKFDLYDNSGEGPSSTGLYAYGAAPGSTGSFDLRPSGIDLHAGHPIQVSMTYDGSILSVGLTDTTTGVSRRQGYAVNIPQIVGGNKAWVGFTGATGGATALQAVSTWTFSNNQGAGTTPGRAQPKVLKVAGKKNANLASVLEIAPQHAKNFSLDEKGNFTYTADPSFVGTDTFSYACVNTATHRCSNDLTTVTIKVRKADQAPTLSTENPNVAYTAAGQAVEVDLRGFVNDIDTDISKIFFRPAAGSQHGTVRILADGHTALFRPAAKYTGPASFNFIASDRIKASRPLSFNVNVSPLGTDLSVNDIYAPAARGFATGIPWNLFAADIDPAATISLAAIGSQPAHGTAKIVNNRLVYTPAANFAGSDSFTYQVQDSNGKDAIGRVYIDRAVFI